MAITQEELQRLVLANASLVQSLQQAHADVLSLGLERAALVKSVEEQQQQQQQEAPVASLLRDLLGDELARYRNRRSELTLQLEEAQRQRLAREEAERRLRTE